MPKVKDNVQSMIKKMFNDQVDIVTHDEDGKFIDASEELKASKITNKDIRRRTNATIRYIDLFSKSHNEYSREEITDAVSIVEAGNLYLSEYNFNSEYCPLGGAAIWLLDNMRENQMLDECCEILNTVDYDIFDLIDAPKIKTKGHYLYSDDLVENLYMIMYDCKFNKNADKRVLEVWQKIKVLIPNEDIDEIIDEAKHFIDLYIKCSVDCSIYVEKELIRKGSSIYFDRQNEKRSITPKYALLHIATRKNYTTNGMIKYIGNELSSFMQPYFDEIYKNEIPIYGLCVAYYFLSEKDEVYSNLDAILQTVFSSIFALLPWRVNMLLGDELDKKIDYNIRNSVTLDTYYSVYYPIFSIHSDNNEYLANFAQYYFLKNESILPYTEIREPVMDFSDFEEEIANKFSYYDQFLSLTKESQRLDLVGYNETSDNDVWDDFDDFDEFEEDEDIEETINDAESSEVILDSEELETLRKENKKLKAQIKIYEQTNYSQDKEYRKLELQYSRLSNEYDLCRRQMSELNESIFNREIVTDEKEEQEEKQELEINLPYTAVKNNVIFGGHPTWLKAIKGMIKNVKFVDNIQFSVDLIKNADVVWVQSNAISHSEYYKIIDATRLYNKALHYFKYPSAIKCVKQFIEIDSELK